MLSNGRGGLSLDEAREAARRAAFLNMAQQTSRDGAYKQGLMELYQFLRAEAIRAGAAQGISEAEVVNSIAALCDADVQRMKTASDEEVRRFAQESGEMLNRCLSALQA